MQCLRSEDMHRSKSDTFCLLEQGDSEEAASTLPILKRRKGCQIIQNKPMMNKLSRSHL
jgi:hypothetical protein